MLSGARTRLLPLDRPLAGHAETGREIVKRQAGVPPQEADFHPRQRSRLESDKEPHIILNGIIINVRNPLAIDLHQRDIDEFNFKTQPIIGITGFLPGLGLVLF